LATGETISGLLVLVPFALIVYGIEPLPFHGYDIPLVLGSYLFLSMASIWLYFYVLKAGGPIFASMAGFISLAAGVVFGMVLFGERHTPWVLVSMLGMMLAIWLTSRQGSNDPKTETQ